MYIYYAGTENKSKIRLLQEYGINDFLVSYYHVRKNKDLSLYAPMHSFLDSGGFTARKSGVDIDIYQYGQFIKANPFFKNYANLDVSNIETTLKNQAILEGMGLNPIPVFHMDEWQKKRWEILDEYIKKHDYIAIGGVAEGKFTRELLYSFLDFVFYRTRDKIRVHGFGMTAIDLLKRYPFYSVDSTSWLAGGRYNFVMTLKGTDLKSSHEFRGLSNMEKDRRNIMATIKMTKFITALWEKRGIKWD